MVDVGAICEAGANTGTFIVNFINGIGNRRLQRQTLDEQSRLAGLARMDENKHFQENLDLEKMKLKSANNGAFLQDIALEKQNDADRQARLQQAANGLYSALSDNTVLQKSLLGRL